MADNDSGTTSGERSYQLLFQSYVSSTLTTEQDIAAWETVINALRTEKSTQQVAQSFYDKHYRDAIGQLDLLGEELSDDERQSLANALQPAADLPQSIMQGVTLEAVKALRKGTKKDVAYRLVLLGHIVAEIQRDVGSAASSGFVATQDTVDTHQLAAILTQASMEVSKRVRDQALQPQTPNAYAQGTEAGIAANEFNRIVAGLQLKFPPDPPGKLKATPVSSTEIKLEWEDQANNADGFRVLRCERKDCSDFKEIGKRLGKERSYLDRNLASNTYYRYKVIAFNFLGEGTSPIIDVTIKP
jgi:hypothetical protein